MNNLRKVFWAAFAVVSALAGPGAAWAQHLDVLVQQIDGQLVTGSADFDHSQWTLGRRVFSHEFDGDFAVNDPGYNAIGAGSPSLPPGSQGLPGNTALQWDFLPMTVEDARQNLFYWDGSDTDGLPGLTPDDVAFATLPGLGYLMSLFDRSGAKYSVDGADELVPGGVIDNTAADGSLHRHRYYYLESGSGQPADGIYLFAMQLRMTGLETSDPIYMVFGTPGSSVAALDDAAIPWVTDNVDLLIPPSLTGDYNGNGIVDAADYCVWRDALEASFTELLNDPTPGTVDESDWTYWKAHFGEVLTPGAGSLAGTAAVPEPSTLCLAVLAVGGARLGKGRRRVRTPGLQRHTTTVAMRRHSANHRL